MTSLHFLFAFCSYCILLQLVAVEIKAGFFFFFFWVLILLVYEKDCILKFYCIFVQIVCNNFTYEIVCKTNKVSTRSVIQDAQVSTS